MVARDGPIRARIGTCAARPQGEARDDGPSPSNDRNNVGSISNPETKIPPSGGVSTSPWGRGWWPGTDQSEHGLGRAQRARRARPVTTGRVHLTIETMLVRFRTQKQKSRHRAGYQHPLGKGMVARDGPIRARIGTCAARPQGEARDDGPSPSNHRNNVGSIPNPETKIPPSGGVSASPGEGDGGQGRNRTIDTRIFSPLLYQLSYLAKGLVQGRVLNRDCQS